MPPSAVNTDKCIAIVGSLLSVQEEESSQRAKEACVEIGKQLARAGYRIIVYSARPTFIEPHIVRGYIESGKAKVGSIMIYAPHGRDGRSRERFEQEENHIKLFDLRPSNQEKWKVSFYDSLGIADGVLLLGGNTTTLIAGMWAIVRGLPVLTVTMFGGSSLDVWKVAGERLDRDVHARLGADAWRSETAADLVSALDDQFRRKQQRHDAEMARRKKERRKGAAPIAVTTMVAISAVFMVAATVIGVMAEEAPSVFLVAFFVVLAAGGAVGGSSYLLFGGKRRLMHEEPAVTIPLGSVAGLFVGSVFFASRVFTDSGFRFDNMDLQFRAIIIAIAPLAIAAGISFRRVFEKMQQADVMSGDLGQTSGAAKKVKNSASVVDSGTNEA